MSGYTIKARYPSYNLEQKEYILSYLFGCWINARESAVLVMLS